jgi:hypothetical protein
MKVSRLSQGQRTAICITTIVLYRVLFAMSSARSRVYAKMYQHQDKSSAIHDSLLEALRGVSQFYQRHPSLSPALHVLCSRTLDISSVLVTYKAIFGTSREIDALAPLTLATVLGFIMRTLSVYSTGLPTPTGMLGWSSVKDYRLSGVSCCDFSTSHDLFFSGHSMCCTHLCRCLLRLRQVSPKAQTRSLATVLFTMNIIGLISLVPTRFHWTMDLITGFLAAETTWAWSSKLLAM